MKNVTVHTGILQIVERAPSSAMGNPRYVVLLDGYTARTAVDSSLGYRITNFDGKKVTAHIGTHYGTRTIENVRLAD